METPGGGTVPTGGPEKDAAEDLVPFPPEMGYKVGDRCSFEIVQVDDDGWAHGKPVGETKGGMGKGPPKTWQEDLRETMGEERMM